jgi:hypothetical protein
LYHVWWNNLLVKLYLSSPAKTYNDMAGYNDLPAYVIYCKPRKWKKKLQLTWCL